MVNVHDVNMHDICFLKNMDDIHLMNKNISLLILGLPEVCKVFPLVSGGILAAWKGGSE